LPCIYPTAIGINILEDEYHDTEADGGFRSHIVEGRGANCDQPPVQIFRNWIIEVYFPRPQSYEIMYLAFRSTSCVCIKYEDGVQEKATAAARAESKRG
jgi:hypothetical protein